MPTVPYKDSLKMMVKDNPEMAIEMLEDAVSTIMSGDLDDGRLLLRQFVNATIGFPELAKLTGKDEKNLMRSLSQTGNPTASNLFIILNACTNVQGVKINAHLVSQTENTTMHP